MSRKPIYMTPIFAGGIGDTIATKLWGKGRSGLFTFTNFPLRLPCKNLRPEPITLDSKELELYGTVARYGKRKDKLLWCSFSPEIPDFIQSRLRQRAPGRRRSLPSQRGEESRRNQR